MSYNALGQEKQAVAAKIAPQTINTAAGTVSSGVADASRHEQLTARVNIGTVAAADVVITITQGNTAAMGGAKVLKTHTVAAATPPSDKFVVMSVRGQDFDTNNGFRWARLDIVHNEATGGPISGELVGSDGPYEPASDYNISDAIVVAYP